MWDSSCDRTAWPSEIATFEKIPQHVHRKNVVKGTAFAFLLNVTQTNAKRCGCTSQLDEPSDFRTVRKKDFKWSDSDGMHRGYLHGQRQNSEILAVNFGSNSNTIVSFRSSAIKMDTGLLSSDLGGGGLQSYADNLTPEARIFALSLCFLLRTQS